MALYKSTSFLSFPFLSFCEGVAFLSVVDMQMLVGMMDDIQKHYEHSVAEDGRLWVEGQIAVSQFTDDKLFYRARVLNVIDADTVEVRLNVVLIDR